MMYLPLLLIIPLVSPIHGGVWRTTSERSSFMDSVVGAVESVTRTTGNYLPIRGVAGYMADAGIPGGVWLRKTLTPETMKSWDRLDQQPSFKKDFLYMVGAVLGEEECTRKLACRSGKRVSSLPGTSLITMGLAAATEYIPEGLRSSYSVLRDSLMYSDDCEQFQCHPSTGLKAISSMADVLGIPVGGFLAQYMGEEEGRGQEKELKIEKYLIEQLVLAIAGNKECGKLLACSLAKRVTGIPGASTVVYFMDSAGVPEYMMEAVDVFRMSVMLGGDCGKFRCSANETMQEHLEDEQYKGGGEDCEGRTGKKDEGGDQILVVEQGEGERNVVDEQDDKVDEHDNQIDEQNDKIDQIEDSEDDSELTNHIPWMDWEE